MYIDFSERTGNITENDVLQACENNKEQIEYVVFNPTHGSFIIDANSFKDCIHLTGFSNLECASEIKAHAFENCAIKDFWIDKATLTAIGDYAFNNTALTAIHWFINLKMGEGVFANCSSLTAVYAYANNKNISDKLFYNCTALSVVEHLELNDNIGDYAFYNCPCTITGDTVWLDKSTMKRIGDYAFYNCNKSKEWVFDPNITYIGIDAFKGNNKYYGKTAEELGLTSGIELRKLGGGRIAYMSDEAYEAWVDPEKILDLTEYEGTIGQKEVNDAIEAHNASTSDDWTRKSDFAAVIGDNVTKIADNAFYGCTGMTKITMQKVAEIGKNAFNGCSALAYAALGSGGQKIGNSAFRGCTSLSRIDGIEDTLSVMDCAFMDCTSLGQLNLQRATYVGSNAFRGCSGVTDLSVYNAAEIEDGAFNTGSNYTVNIR